MRISDWSSDVCSSDLTYGVHVVDKVTANPGVTGCEPIGVQTDHITICKPATRTATVFKSVCAFIRQLLTKITPTTTREEGRGGKERVGQWSTRWAPVRQQKK